MDDAENVIARAVVEKDNEKGAIVTLLRKGLLRSLDIRDAGSSQPISEEERERLADLARELPTGTSDEEWWNTFVTKLRELNFETRILPPHDYELQVAINPHRPVVMSVARASDDAALSPGADSVARNIHDSLVKELRGQRERIEANLARLVDAGDHAAASDYVRSERAGIQLFGDKKVLSLLVRIELAGLSREQRRSVLEAILLVSSATSDNFRAGVAAQAMLAEFGAELSDALKQNLKLCRANAESESGHRETARVLYQQLLNDSDTVATTRAWALRGLSLNVEPLDAAAIMASERAGDAFLEAGQRTEAAKDYLSVARKLIHVAPERALELVDRVLPWFDGNDVGSRNARAEVQQIRANLLSKTAGHIDEALDAALDAVALRTGIYGAETELISSYFLAAFMATQKGDEEQRKKLETVAGEMVEKLPAEKALRFRMGRASRTVRQQIREAKPPGWDKELEILCDILEAVEDNGLTYDERIAILERAQDRLKDSHFHRDLDLQEQIAAAFAEVHRRNENVDQAMVWYRKVLAQNPAHPVARQNLAAFLQRRAEWPELIDLLRKQIQHFGEYPGVLLALGRALIQNGSPGDAIKPLYRAQQVATQPAQLKLINKELDRAIREAPSVPLTEPPPTSLVKLSELEACLSSFAEHVKRDRRMEFWQKGDANRRWRNEPESLAKSLLWSYLQGRFQSRVEVLEEVRSGAGRIDLYLRFEGGLRVVIELKMCGAPYSAGYAEEGVDQLVHYMENKGTAIGYLVVFDARKRDNAKNFQHLPDTGKSSVYVVFVDVRPMVTG